MRFNNVFEDEEILVLDKEADLVVNRSATVKKEETLQDQLGDYFGLGENLGIGGRAGIVHRLDRETSGLLVAAKSEKAFLDLQRQFRQRGVNKEYTALVHGSFGQTKGRVDAPIGRVGAFGKFGVITGGREAVTEFEVMDKFAMKNEVFEKITENENKNRTNYLKVHAREYSLLRVYPKTGRTHQIRVHLKSIHLPLVCDKIYTPAKILKFDLAWCPRLFLHSAFLEFTHPKTKKRVSFEADLPQELKAAFFSLTIIQ